MDVSKGHASGQALISLINFHLHRQRCIAPRLAGVGRALIIHLTVVVM